jgi:hypothetical protein
VKLWALSYVVTDGYTFSCTNFIGVFETEALAIEAAIFHFEDPQNKLRRPDNLDDYSTQEIEVGALVDL